MWPPPSPKKFLRSGLGDEPRTCYHKIMKVCVVGNGAWGTALFGLVRENCPNVSFFKKELKAQTADVIVIAVPTQALREVVGSIKRVNGVAIVNCAKGIERTTHKLPFQIVSELLGSDTRYFSLIGPSFAVEVKKKMPTLVNLGYSHEDNIDDIKNLFQTDYFRVRPTSTIQALELSGALKNVYAIACGVATGLGFGMNTRVKLILLALEEITSLAQKLNFTIDRDDSPGFIGDLILTCNSIESRNFTFGKLLTKYTKAESLAKIRSTVEGQNTVLSVPYFTEKTGLKLPLANFVYDIIGEDCSQKVAEKFDKFVASVS